MSTDAKPITRPGVSVDKTPAELLDVPAQGEVTRKWQESMDRISDAERGAEDEMSKIHIR